jgi:hypothetical protein
MFPFFDLPPAGCAGDKTYETPFGNELPGSSTGTSTGKTPFPKQREHDG